MERNQGQYRMYRHVRVGRVAVVIDLDNITLAGRRATTPHEASWRLRDVAEAVGAWDLSLCIGSRRMVQDLALWPVLHRLGLTWRIDPGGKDVADQLLMDFALYEIAHGGVTKVVVASGDGAFAELAAEADLVVCVPHDHLGVSRALAPYRINQKSAKPAPVKARRVANTKREVG